MIDIQKDGMKPARGLNRVKARLWCSSQSEKVALNKPASGITGQNHPQRDQPVLVPVDYTCQRLDHQQRLDVGMF